MERAEMAARTRYSFRMRTAIVGLVALLIWAAFSLVLPLAEARPDVTLFGLPLQTALALPVALPVLVLTMFWFAARQNSHDERFGNDD
jgi:putative solute:sodium symporter small subunit